MHPETRRAVFDLTVDEVRAALDLSARAVVALVEAKLLGAALPRRGLGAPSLDDARFRSDQVRWLKTVPGELARTRAAFPRRMPDYDKAIALGALLTALGR